MWRYYGSLNYLNYIYFVPESLRIEPAQWTLVSMHSTGTSVNSTFFQIRNFCLGFTMVVYEKIHIEAYINIQ